MTICHVAEALGLHPSRISRLETGAAEPAADEVIQYLKAIGSEAAALYRDILATRWVEIDRPDPWHPDARALIDAMALLQKLDEQIVADLTLPQSLSGQAQFLRSRLLGSAAYLSNLAHCIAFIGKIGDGKAYRRALGVEFATSMCTFYAPTLLHGFDIQPGRVVCHFQGLFLLIQNQQHRSFFELSKRACVGEFSEKRVIVGTRRVTKRGAKHRYASWII